MVAESRNFMTTPPNKRYNDYAAISFGNIMSNLCPGFFKIKGSVGGAGFIMTSKAGFFITFYKVDVLRILCSGR
jgi:hypothetical protein